MARTTRLIWHETLGDGYLTRWVADFGWFSVRLHHWTGSDDLRAPHDHEWDFWSILLRGEMWDRQPGPNGGYSEGWKETAREPLRWTFFPAEHRHSVRVGSSGAWTLLVTGPRRRQWGFWTPRGHDGVVRFRKRNKYFYEHGHH